MTHQRPAGEVVDAVARGGLLEDPAPVLLLCSAGRDSHCLLDVAVRVRGAQALRVLHVDHGLRPGAVLDAEQLQARCAELGVALTIAHAGTRPAGGNLQAWARGERKRLAELERVRVGARVVATAHTRSDLVETALGRLATQPGRRALLSMRAREANATQPGAGILVRPLLEFTRAATGAYCTARGLAWREDPSNADRTFARARLRYGVVPVLRSLNPRAEDTIARTLAELAEEGAVLDALVAAELPAPGTTIALQRLAELPAPLARLVLRELAERAAGAPCPRAASRLDDLLGLAATAERAGQASLDVGGGVRLQLRGGIVRCLPSPGRAAR